MKQIIVNHETLQTRVALIIDNRIEEYYIERNDAPRIVGSIFKGRIKNFEPSLQAAFVDIGLEKNAFLHYWDMIPATKELLESEEGLYIDEDEDEIENEEELRRIFEKYSGLSEEELEAFHPESEEEEEKQDQLAEVPTELKTELIEPSTQQQEEKISSLENKGISLETKSSYSSPLHPLLRGLKRLFAPLLGLRVEEEPELTTPSPSTSGSEISHSKGSTEREYEKSYDRPSKSRSFRNGRRHGGEHGKDFHPRISIDEIPKRFSVNDEVIVQVTKGIIGDKGPRITTNLSIPGKYVVLLPNSPHRGVSRRIPDKRERQRLRQIIQQIELPEGMGMICRTAAQHVGEAELRADVELILEQWHQSEQLKKRRAPVCIYQEPPLIERSIRDMLAVDIDEIIVDSREAFKAAIRQVKRIDSEHRPKVILYDNPTPIFEYFNLEPQIANIFQRKLTLPSGAELVIDETEAMITIDINSSKSRTGKDHPETILNTNLEAVKEIARQLKLRNVGGLVVIDFIDMRSRKDKQLVYRQMKEAMASDRAKSKILPISRLGLMEMTRQREHESLQHTVFEDCFYCAGRGKIKSPTTVSAEIQRALNEVLKRTGSSQKIPLRVQVHPRILDRLRNEDREILEQMEQEYGGELSFRAEPQFHQEEFTLIDLQNNKVLKHVKPLFALHDSSSKDK